MKKHSNKDKIIEQVKLLMDEDAFSTMTVREICGRADVSIGSFYHHFKSKEDLIMELFRISSKRAEENQRLNMNNENEWKNLDAYILFQIKLLEETPIDRLKYIYTYNLNHYQPAALAPNRDIIKSLLVRAQTKGQMNRQLTIEESLEHIFALILANSINYCMRDAQYDIKKQLLDQIHHLVSLISA